VFWSNPLYTTFSYLCFTWTGHICLSRFIFPQIAYLHNLHKHTFSIIIMFSISIHPSSAYLGPGRGGSSLEMPRLPSPEPLPPVLPGGHRGVRASQDSRRRPQCPRSSPGSPPRWTCSAHLPGKAFRRYPEQIPEPPDPSRCGGAAALPWASHPIARDRPATLWRKLISAANIRDLVLSVKTQSSWPYRRVGSSRNVDSLTGKSRAFPCGSAAPS